MLNVIINHFDIWTSTQTAKANGRGRSIENQTLHGVNKFRELVLELVEKYDMNPMMIMIPRFLHRSVLCRSRM